MTRQQRAQQIWQVLTSTAHNRQIITYEQLANLIGMGPGTLAGPLGCIMYYCEQRDLPPLTTTVVNKKVGKPGGGLNAVESHEIEAKRQDVYAHSWFLMLPPSAEDFAEAYGKGEGSGRAFRQQT